MMEMGMFKCELLAIDVIFSRCLQVSYYYCKLVLSSLRMSNLTLLHRYHMKVK